MLWTRRSDCRAKAGQAIESDVVLRQTLDAAMSHAPTARFRPGCFLLALIMDVIAALASPHAARAAKRPLVQKRFFQVTSGSSVSVTFRKPNTAGNLIVAYVVWDNGGAVSLTDSRGNTYASAVGPTQASGDTTSAQIFYAANIAGGAEHGHGDLRDRRSRRAACSTSTSTRASIASRRSTRRSRRRAPRRRWTAASLTTAGANELLFVGGESNGRADRARDARLSRPRAPLRQPDRGARSPPTAGSYNVDGDADRHRLDHAARRLQAGRQHAADHGLSAEGERQRPLPRRPERRALPDHRRLAAGADGQPLRGRGRRASSPTARRPASTSSGSTCCAPPTRAAAPTAAPTTASSRSPRPDDLATPNEAYFARVDHMLDARGAARARRAARSGRDRQLPRAC